jgi:hypothetical protein
VLVQPALLVEAVVGGADVEPARRHVEGRVLDLHPVERAVDDGRRFDVVVDALDARPTTRQSATWPGRRVRNRRSPAPRRVQHRHHRVHQGEFALMRHGGGFRPVVVAHQRQHAAVARGARRIGVAEHVAGAVDAGTLAVPHAEHAVIGAFAAHLGLLRAPQGGRRQVFVDGRLEQDVAGLEHARGAHELLIEPAQAASRDSR